MIHRDASAWCVGFGIGLACLDAGFAAAPAAGSREDSPAALVKREEDLLRQYRDLERSFLRLADLLAATDPRRSAVLRSVFDKARAEQVGDRFDTIVRLLEQGQLLKAGASQQSAIERCRMLLDLLESGDGERRNADARKEVRQFLARLAKLIARQRDVEGSTDSGARIAELGERQAAVTEEARGLADEIGGFARRLEGRGAGDAADGSRRAVGEGGVPAADSGAPGASDDAKASGGAAEGNQSEGGADPSDAASDPPGDDDASRARRTERRLTSARQRMQAARERLDEARRTEARVEQDRALEELETARAELEEILRQMREQEVERLLVQLEARVRQMLKAQRQLLTAVESLAADPPGAQRERELEAARLGREQAAIGTEATKALTLVRDDGSAVAIPQALEGVRDDAAMASARLARGDVAAVTRGLMGDLVTGLEELLAALEKAQRDAAREKGAEAPGGRAGAAGEQPLVDAIAEIRMLRSLQMRVNVRTRRFSQLIADGEEQADEPELVAALARLAERQREIQRAASDIVSGRTE